MIRCPLCDYEAGRREVHAHLVEAHPEAVEMWTDARTARRRYRIECPICHAAHEAQVKPRGHDEAFLETYRREIRMVAFDMLLNHVQGEHFPAQPLNVPQLHDSRSHE